MIPISPSKVRNRAALRLETASRKLNLMTDMIRDMAEQLGLDQADATCSENAAVLLASTSKPFAD